MVMKVFINPGSGPVEDATEENATEGIKKFVEDIGIKGVGWIRVPEEDCGDGRFAFLLWKDTRCHLIHMPGLPFEKVRYINEEQNIWDFPRLYVNGSSWVWKFALHQCEAEAFRGPIDD